MRRTKNRSALISREVKDWASRAEYEAGRARLAVLNARTFILARVSRSIHSSFIRDSSLDSRKNHYGAAYCPGK